MHPDDSHLGSPDRLLAIFICTISGNNFEYQGDRVNGLRRLKQTSVLRLGSYIQSTAVLNSLRMALSLNFLKDWLRCLF